MREFLRQARQAVLAGAIVVAFGYGFCGTVTYARFLFERDYLSALQSPVGDRYEVFINGSADEYDQRRLDEAIKAIELALEELVDNDGRFRSSDAWRVERLRFLLAKAYHRKGLEVQRQEEARAKAAAAGHDKLGTATGEPGSAGGQSGTANPAGKDKSVRPGDSPGGAPDGKASGEGSELQVKEIGGTQVSPPGRPADSGRLFQRAIEEYEATLRINPHNFAAKYNLEMLKKNSGGSGGQGGSQAPSNGQDPNSKRRPKI